MYLYACIDIIPATNRMEKTEQKYRSFIVPCVKKYLYDFQLVDRKAISKTFNLNCRRDTVFQLLIFYDIKDKSKHLNSKPSSIFKWIYAQRVTKK